MKNVRILLISSLLLLVLVFAIAYTYSNVNLTARVITDEWTKEDIPMIENPDPHKLILSNFGPDDRLDRGNKEYYLHPLVVDTEIIKEQQPISRGDVIYFILHGEKAEGYRLHGLEDYAYTFSRVVGLPNERVKILNGQVYINDAILYTFYGREHQTGRLVEDSTVSMDEIVIPDDEYFVLHDSWWRSTILEFTIPKEDIVGKIIGYTEHSH